MPLLGQGAEPQQSHRTVSNIQWAESGPERPVPSGLPALVNRSRTKFGTCSPPALNAFRPGSRACGRGSAQICSGALLCALGRSGRPVLALFCLQAMASSAQPGCGVCWAELLFPRQLWHSCVCKGHKSALNDQEKASIQRPQCTEDRGSLELQHSCNAQGLWPADAALLKQTTAGSGFHFTPW